MERQRAVQPGRGARRGQGRLFICRSILVFWLIQKLSELDAKLIFALHLSGAGDEALAQLPSHAVGNASYQSQRQEPHPGTQGVSELTNYIYIE